MQGDFNAFRVRTHSFFGLSYLIIREVGVECVAQTVGVPIEIAARIQQFKPDTRGGSLFILFFA